MNKLVFIAFALGIASLDVTMALFVAGALGARPGTRTLVLFGGVALTGTGSRSHSSSGRVWPG